jgi:hypothetical protein
LRWDNFYLYHGLNELAVVPIAGRINLQTKEASFIKFPRTVSMAFPFYSKQGGVVYDLLRHTDRSDPQDVKHWHELVTLNFDAQTYQTIAVFKPWNIANNFFVYNPDADTFVFNGGANKGGQLYTVTASTGDYKPIPLMDFFSFSQYPKIFGSFWDSSAQTYKLLVADNSFVADGQSNFTVAGYDYTSGTITIGAKFLFPPKDVASCRSTFDSSSIYPLFDQAAKVFYTATTCYGMGGYNAYIYGADYQGNIVSMINSTPSFEIRQWTFA